MTPRFDEIDKKEIQESFPEFYHERGRFFEIIHKEQPIGFLAIGKIDRDDSVLGLFIFKEYRNGLTKGIVLSLLTFPKELGFQRCFITTSKQRIIKVLGMMNKYGVKDLGVVDDEHVFLMDF
jgi:hypothetical protein